MDGFRILGAIALLGLLLTGLLTVVGVCRGGVGKWRRPSPPQQLATRNSGFESRGSERQGKRWMLLE
jgi:hypothetical protein